LSILVPYSSKLLITSNYHQAVATFSLPDILAHTSETLMLWCDHWYKDFRYIISLSESSLLFSLSKAIVIPGRGGYTTDVCQRLEISGEQLWHKNGRTDHKKFLFL
jgi:hypothetical protein